MNLYSNLDLRYILNYNKLRHTIRPKERSIPKVFFYELLYIDQSLVVRFWYEYYYENVYYDSYVYEYLLKGTLLDLLWEYYCVI